MLEFCRIMPLWCCTESQWEKRMLSTIVVGWRESWHLCIIMSFIFVMLFGFPCYILNFHQSIVPISRLVTTFCYVFQCYVWSGCDTEWGKPNLQANFLFLQVPRLGCSWCGICIYLGGYRHLATVNGNTPMLGRQQYSLSSIDNMYRLFWFPLQSTAFNPTYFTENSVVRKRGCMNHITCPPTSS